MRIFLSYGHDAYASLALRIKADLEARGHQVWFDIERLKPGADWERYIEEGIRFASEGQAQGRFLLLMTPHSVRRPNGFCLNELANAYARHIPIVPVMVSTVDPPLSIYRLQWLDMRQCFPTQENEQQYQAKFLTLLKALENKEVPSDGTQQRLIHFLQPMDFSSDISRNLIRFIGRDWLMIEIDEWLSSPRLVLWITGEAGIGKTAIAAWLCSKRFLTFPDITSADSATAIEWTLGDVCFPSLTS